MHLDDFINQLFTALGDESVRERLQMVVADKVKFDKKFPRVLRRNNRTLKVKKLDPRAVLPTQAPGSAGYDLFPLVEQTLLSGGSVTIPLGLAMEFDDDLVGLIQDRSGMGLKGSLRRAGVIDANYRGEWQLILYNSGTAPISISPEKAAAQVVFIEKIRFSSVDEVDDLSETERGDAGFGSTDTKGQ